MADHGHPTAANPQVVVVTGCSGRVGLAVTEELAKRGHTVVGVDVVRRPSFAGTR
jgi:nucleoside-diphosphate-sugar epimerase